jgi:GxxExxY protein
MLYSDETYRILGAAFEVHKALGPGFLESVYQEALEYELFKAGIPAEPQKEICIKYKDHLLKKKFFADIVCFGDVIVEIKAVSEILPIFEAQILNYLKGTSYPVGLLINFGQMKLEHRRFVLTKSII